MLESSHAGSPDTQARWEGSLYYQLHSRLDGWNAAAIGPQKL